MRSRLSRERHADSLDSSQHSLGGEDSGTNSPPSRRSSRRPSNTPVFTQEQARSIKQALFGTGLGSTDSFGSFSFRSRPRRVRVSRCVRRWIATFWLSGLGLRVWRACVVAAIVFTVIMLPLQLAFNEPEVGFISWARTDEHSSSGIGNTFQGHVYVLLDAVLLLDIALTFKIPVYHEGEICYDHRIVAKAYVTSHRLLWDLLGTLPVSYWSAGISPLHLLRLLLLPKLNRCFTTLSSNLEAEARLFVGTKTRLLRLAFAGLLAIHWYGCMWWCLHRLITEKECCGEYNSEQLALLWVNLNVITNTTQPVQYVHSLYRSAAILVAFGYGNHPSVGAAEVGLTLAGIICGYVLVALVTATIVSIVSVANESDRQAQVQMLTVMNFLKDEECPPELVRRVRRHMEYVLLSHKGLTANVALRSISHSLRAEIALFRCRDLVQAVPFLSPAANPDPMFIKRLCLLLHREAFSPGDLMMEEGEVGDNMYFILSGEVDIYVNRGTKLVTTLSSGSYFGEIALLQGLQAMKQRESREGSRDGSGKSDANSEGSQGSSQNQSAGSSLTGSMQKPKSPPRTENRRNATVIATTFTTAFELSRFDFKECLEEYPEMLVTLQSIAKERLRIAKSAAETGRRESMQSASTEAAPFAKSDGFALLSSKDSRDIHQRRFSADHALLGLQSMRSAFTGGNSSRRGSVDGGGDGSFRNRRASFRKDAAVHPAPGGTSNGNGAAGSSSQQPPAWSEGLSAMSSLAKKEARSAKQRNGHSGRPSHDEEESPSDNTPSQTPDLGRHAFGGGNKSDKSGEQHQGLNQMPEQFAGNTSLRESALAPAPEWNTPRE